MRENIELKNIISNVNDKKQLDFLKENLRPFYTKEIFAWQYQNKLKHTTLYFSVAGNKIIASQGMIPIALSYKSKIFLSSKSETSFLLSDYRRNGIFEDLYSHTILESEKDSTELIWGFTALSKVWRDKLGFIVYDGIINEAELQINTVLALKNIIISKESFANKTKHLLKAVFSSFKTFRPIRNKNYLYKKLNFNIETDKAQILFLYKEWRNKYSSYISINPSEEYLNWRVNNNPKKKYEYIGLIKEGKIESLMIINVSNVKSYIVDLIILNEEDVNSILKGYTNFIKENYKFSHLLYWVNSENEYNKNILNSFKNLGANIYKNNSMNFVVKTTRKCTLCEKTTVDVGRYCINGLWTEGFNI